MGHFEDRLTAAYQRRMDWYPMNGVLLSDARKEGTMTPTTPTGKRLVPKGKNFYRRNPDGTETWLDSHSLDDILAIEQEAAAAERARLLRKHRTHVHHDLPPRLVRSYGDWLLDNGGGDPCPGTSSVTGAACLLEGGHTEYKADRFHMFADPEPRPMTPTEADALREQRVASRAVSDYREHEPSADCWCKPEVEYVPPAIGLHTRLVSWLWTHGHYRLARWAAIGRDMP